VLILQFPPVETCQEMFYTTGMNQTFLSNVTISQNRPHIKNTNIPIDLIVGKNMLSVKRDYPWLTKKQIEDALIFVQRVLQSQDFSQYEDRKAVA
jgi:uncharacterized protein (DUF433 family)